MWKKSLRLKASRPKWLLSILKTPGCCQWAGESCQVEVIRFHRLRKTFESYPHPSQGSSLNFPRRWYLICNNTIQYWQHMDLFDGCKPRECMKKVVHLLYVHYSDSCVTQDRNNLCHSHGSCSGSRRSLLPSDYSQGTCFYWAQKTCSTVDVFHLKFVFTRICFT